MEQIGRRGRGGGDRPGRPLLPPAGLPRAGALLLGLVLLSGPPLAALAQSGPLRDVATAVDSAEPPSAETAAESPLRNDASPPPPPAGPPGVADAGRPETTEEEERTPAEAPGTGNLGSVRARGAEAPPPRRPARSARPEESVARAPAAAARRQRTPDRREEPNRVWPVRPDSYTFTQAFGCVPQLGNFYQFDAGCPASRPAVHTGIDLAAPQGTRIYAAASGWVTEAGLDRPSGIANSRIVIQHDGRNADYGTEYLHWSASYVRPGDYVEAGEPIAEVGSVGYSTGPHLHFSVVDLDTGERIDPMRWLPKDESGDGYLGLRPGTRRIPSGGRNVPIPDYADPNPPPPPEREPVPKEPPRAERRDRERGQRDDRGGGRGDRNRDRDRDRNRDGDRNEERPRDRDAEPTAAAEGGRDRSARSDRLRPSSTASDPATDEGRRRSGRSGSSTGEEGKKRGREADAARDGRADGDTGDAGGDGERRRDRGRDETGDAPPPEDDPATGGVGIALPPPVAPGTGPAAPSTRTVEPAEERPRERRERDAGDSSRRGRE